MKKFITFYGSSNSGIQTKEKAIAWASTQMSQKQGLDEVHVAEVIEVVTRTVPTVEVKSFFVALEDNPASKTA